MAKKQFKAESKRLLDMMINSIYTNKEIFLRELISNASDAMDKLYYKSLTEGISGLSRADFSIQIAYDEEARTLSVSDNGIGMNKADLEADLGTIAKSGSRLFKNEAEEADEESDVKNAGDIDIIGQFGVGFYSAFMVADKVEVISKPYGEDQAWRWTSSGADGYTIKEDERPGHGTTVIVTLKADTENENYSKYLDEYQLHSLVKKYSNYIRYPIQMMVTKSRKKEGTEDEYEDYKDLETLNDMSPIWKKQKSEVTDEEYSQFYNQNFYDFNPPLKIIRSSTEGAATYTALLFIPSKAPFNYFSSDYKKGLKLYASGVLIMDSCEDLLPDFFNFVRGLVDSEDLSLNISREMLQQDHQVKVIERVLEKKIKNELLTMLRNEREKYETFFGEFGSQLKFGSYVDYGRNKELLQDLLLFYTSSEGKLSTLDEYVDRMREEQKYIYYACGESIEKIRQLPQVERLQDKGYEMLYCTEDLDEFTLKTMRSYKDKEFRSVSDDDLGIDTEEEKAEARKADEENKELFDFMKEALDGKVVAVRATTRLKSHPVFLSSEGGLSIDMEKVLAQQANPDNRIKAMKVLEINAGHPIFEKMKSLYAEGDKDKVTLYSKLLFGQALLMEGLNVDDPVAFANDICKLM